MTTEQLDEIIQRACAEFPARLGELHAHILEAAAEKLAETQDKEFGGKPKVSIPLKLEINLATAPPKFKTSASVGVKFKSEGDDIMLDDLSQPTFKFEAEEGE